MTSLNFSSSPSWILILLSLWLCGCSSYYGQLALGQAELLRSREPISSILADPQRDSVLKDRLRRALDARNFASSHLELPNNDSYRLYADLHRPYVVWNVFATEEFSVDPIRQCFPIAGCVAYRGYFKEFAARAKAAELKRQQQDTLVVGIDAYSTLGWLSDPLLNTMMRRDDDQVAALIFHELTHQKLYVKGDTAFNESYASFVEREGQRQWRKERGLPPPKADRAKAYRQMVTEILATRERLRQLYTRRFLTPEMLRERKQAEFSQLRQTYRRLRAQEWGGKPYFEHWFKLPLNNASLLPFGLYDQWLPAFERLFQQHQGQWAAFHAAVAQLAQLTETERRKTLEQLVSESSIPETAAPMPQATVEAKPPK